MKKYLSTIFKILGFTFLGIIGFVLIVLAGLNIFKYVYYNDYFSKMEKIAKNLKCKKYKFTNYQDF